MFLRANKRFKDGKEHRYWSVVENRRIEAHIFISFRAYCLHVTLAQYNKKAATGNYFKTLVCENRTRLCAKQIHPAGARRRRL